jgi:hypothetical protein
MLIIQDRESTLQKQSLSIQDEPERSGQPAYDWDVQLITNKAVQNLDLALENAKMLCQYLNDCLVGSAFFRWLFDLDYETVPFLADFLDLGIRFYLDSNFQLVLPTSHVREIPPA